MTAFTVDTVSTQTVSARATIKDILRHWAETQPEAPAFVSEDQAPLTYGALYKAIGTIGEALNTSGFGRGDRIAVVHSGGPQLALTLYGVLTAAAASPLKPGLTQPEFQRELEARRIDGVIVEAGLKTRAREAAAELGLPVLAVSPSDEAVTGLVRVQKLTGRERRPAVPAVLDDDAFILGTSATTAQSKIVPWQHRHLVARAASLTALMGLGPADRCLNLMPMLYGQARVAAVLYSGGSLVCLADFDPGTFFRYLDALRPTWYQGSYTFHHVICRQAANFPEAVAKSCLRFIRTTSGRLAPKISQQLEQLFGVPMVESYSSTETGLIAGNGPASETRHPGTAGLPAPGCDLRIRADDGSFVPQGTEGEVVVRGDEVVDGYEGDPNLTAAAFTDGWFRTGDLGYLGEDGFLRLTGRLKEMINRGGEKISPAEVDAVLMAHPAVAQAVTFATPHPTLGELPAAVVVLEDGSDLAEKELLNFLRDRLAAFKVPRQVVFVDDIPRSDALKIQRNQLAVLLGLGAPVANRKPGK